MENTYWSQNGKYQAEYDRLAGLMPAMGNSNKVAGELIRCVSRLGHELYNNGMGNNSSGAVNMLRAYGAIDGDTYETIYPMTRGRIYNSGYNGDAFQIAIESSIDQTIKFILDNPELETTPNTQDMFDWQEDEQSFCDECGDENEGYNAICDDCEQSFEEQEEEDCYCC